MSKARFTMVYETTEGVQLRENRSANDVETIGRVVSRLVDRDAAWGVKVLDESGTDVAPAFSFWRMWEA